MHQVEKEFSDEAIQEIFPKFVNNNSKCLERGGPLKELSSWVCFVFLIWNIIHFWINCLCCSINTASLAAVRLTDCYYGKLCVRVMDQKRSILKKKQTKNKVAKRSSVFFILYLEKKDEIQRMKSKFWIWNKEVLRLGNKRHIWLTAYGGQNAMWKWIGWIVNFQT